MLRTEISKFHYTPHTDSINAADIGQLRSIVP
jgi:hypothetical protein